MLRPYPGRSNAMPDKPVVSEANLSQPLRPAIPPRPQPPLGREAASLGKDVPHEPSLGSARVIRGGVGAIPAVWEE